MHGDGGRWRDACIDRRSDTAPHHCMSTRLLCSALLFVYLSSIHHVQLRSMMQEWTPTTNNSIITHHTHHTQQHQQAHAQTCTAHRTAHRHSSHTHKHSRQHTHTDTQTSTCPAQWPLGARTLFFSSHHCIQNTICTCICSMHDVACSNACHMCIVTRASQHRV